MKTYALATAAAGLIALACLLNQPLLGQVTITDYHVWKLVTYYQTDLATTNIRSGNAYYFMAGISGSNLGSLTPGLKLNDISINMYAPFANPSVLDAAYPGGNTNTYTLNTDSTTTILSGTLGSASTDFLAPAHVNNGTWSAGALQVDPFSNCTVQFDAFPLGVTNGALEFLLRDQTLATVSVQYTNTGVLDWVIPANTLTPGQTYSGTIGFFNLSAPLVIDAINSGSVGSIGMATSLNFSIAAIPEPATYAAWFGLAASGFAAYRRRHRQAG